MWSKVSSAAEKDLRKESGQAHAVARHRAGGP